MIIDSASHMHDGPGGVLEWHEEILDRVAGKDYDKRQRATFTAWVEPKAAENAFIYAMLAMPCPVVLCLRAKEKIKISKGKVEELGWQPIAGERVAFETIFTLMLPPHSKGVPSLEISEMREPFDAIVPKGKPIDEDLGRKLADWSRGGAQSRKTDEPAVAMTDERRAILDKVTAAINLWFPGQSDAEKTAKGRVVRTLFKKSWNEVAASQPIEDLEAVLLGGDESRLNKVCADQKAAMVA